MHKSSFDEMERVKVRFLSGVSGTIVDIGSKDFNGNYKSLFPNMKYIGLDQEYGPNVDKLMKSDFDTGLEPFSADLVISGQTLEHCRNPFRLVAEMYRICKTGAYCIIIAPSVFNEHRYPIDCWRFLPDGMDELLKNAGFEVVKSYVTKTKYDNPIKTFIHRHFKDCWGIGVKK